MIAKVERIRLKFPGCLKAALRAKAPFVGIPYRGGERPIVLDRKVLTEIADCPKLEQAEIVLNGTRKLRLWGKGAEYNMLSLEREPHKLFTIREVQEKWARSQRKRLAAPKPNKANHKLIALDKEITKLEKQLSRNWYWNDEAPKNPVLLIGKPCENLPESKREEEGCLWNWERRAWQSNREEKSLRSKVGRLAMQTWKRWQDLINALAAIGVVFPKKPKLAGKAVCLREIDSAVKLVTVCQLMPSFRGDALDWSDKLDAYVTQRSQWLERKRNRKAVEQKLTDLREIRSMPEKVAESDIGLPEDVTVETLE